MKNSRAGLGRRYPWSTCSAELPRRTFDDVRQTVFLMPSMHLVIPLTAPADVKDKLSDEQEESLPAAAYQWARPEKTAEPMRWRGAGPNPPLMRTRFVGPESETR